MAEAILSAVLEQLASIIRVEVEREVRLVVGVDKDVEELTGSLGIVQAVLEDAEMKQVTSEAVKLWLQDLKHIMYDADDVLDEWFTRLSISQSQNSGVTVDGVSDKVRVRSYLSSLCSCFQPVIVRHEIAHRIVDIKERLDKNGHSVSQLKLISKQKQEDKHHPPIFTSSIVNPSEIHGRVGDKEVILGRMFAESSTPISVIVISIVGMGGLGKTTLAQLIYNEEELMPKFELKMWVCVSQPFDRERLAKEIIQQATGGKPDVIGWEPLHILLSKSVERKRFLLVLDDVWTNDYNDWHPLKLSLDCGAPGSRVLVTTRNVGVANMIGSSYTHKLGQLADDDCWSIFRHVALPGYPDEMAREFEIFKTEIVDKSKGVPLAAKTLGGLMRLKQTKQEWRNVLGSQLWELPQDGRGFFPALLLSYQDLPSHLKRCFMYTAIFPKDAIIPKDTLMKLWMAQGFLGLDGSRELEMIGGEYFDDLAMRSFFQDFKKDIRGNIVTCKMHDLVHDFAQFLTKTECSILEKNDADFSYTKVRHLCINEECLENGAICEGMKVRTLICPNILESKLSGIFDHLKCLRALDLRLTGITELPEEIERFLHLRYLDLSRNVDLRELPETICNLYNLQTLKLNWCYGLRKLPEGVGRLLNLRHLEVKDTNFQCILKSIGKLSQLRTLSKFFVNAAREGYGTIKELGNLNRLSGSLEIRELWQVEDEKDATRAQLQKKENLYNLELHFRSPGNVHTARMESVAENMVRMDSVLEGLQPHRNLETLRICHYPGSSFPLWMLMCDSLLPNIVELKLQYCKNCTQLPPLGKLRSLETLDLLGIKTKHVGAQLLGVSNGSGDGASMSASPSVILFPKLKTLKLSGMDEWEEEMWEAVSTSIMPCLQTLNIYLCKKLKVVPSYMFAPSLRSLTISFCPQLTAMQPCLPPLLEKLQLLGDVGAVSSSLLSFSTSTTTTTTTTNNNNQSSPNLKSVSISHSFYSSLPQGLNNFTSLQDLIVHDCKFLDLKPEEDLRHFPMLQEMGISTCPNVEKRCIREDWSALSNIPYQIKINGEVITRRS